MPPATPAPAARSCSRSTRLRRRLRSRSAAGYQPGDADDLRNCHRRRGRGRRHRLSLRQRRHHADRHRDRRQRRRVDHQRHAVGRWRPQHRGPGHRCRRQHRQQQRGRVHARHACPDGCDHQQRRAANQATQTISGTVAAGEAAVGGTVYLYDNGGTTAIGTATVGSGGMWTTTVTLSGDGAHTIVAQDTDAAGNTGTSTALIFTLDTIAPTVAITSSGGLPTRRRRRSPERSPPARPRSAPPYYLDDNGGTTAIGTATVGSGGVWTTTVTLSGDGAHSIVAQDTDAAGNTGTSTRGRVHARHACPDGCDQQRGGPPPTRRRRRFPER